MTTADKRELRILALSLNDWSDQWTNRQHLLSRLARENTVIHSKGGWFSWDLRSSAWRASPLSGQVTRADDVYLDQCPRYWVRFAKFPKLEQLALSRIGQRWNHWLANHGRGPRALVVFHPDLFPYVPHVKRDILVYHAYDLFEHTPGWNNRRQQLQIELLRHADLVTASSSAIAENLQALVAREIRVLPNGVDILDYHLPPNGITREPEDLRTIAHPRLGYVGSLVFTVDFELVAALASRHPQWHFVFVGEKGGKLDQRLEASFNRCQDLPNVYFLGRKHIREVAAYSMNMDVNLMLYRISDAMWTQAGYPLKLHEYLAAGKPVISADLSTVRAFDHVVRIAFDIGDWENAIREALEFGGTGTPTERRAIAAQNTWDMRVKTLRTWIWEHLDRAERK